MILLLELNIFEMLFIFNDVILILNTQLENKDMQRMFCHDTKIIFGRHIISHHTSFKKILLFYFALSPTFWADMMLISWGGEFFSTNKM